MGPNDAEVEKFLESLAADPAIEVRAAVAQTLGRSESSSATAFATEEKLTSDKDVFVQAEAIAALGNFPTKYIASCPLLYRAYLSKQKLLVDGAQSSLEKITKSAAFNAAAARESKEAPLRFTAAYGLNPNSDEGFQSLTRAMKDPDPGVRFIAAVKLGTVSPGRADATRKALESSLADEKNDDVRGMIRFSQGSWHRTGRIDGH